MIEGTWAWACEQLLDSSVVYWTYRGFPQFFCLEDELMVSDEGDWRVASVTRDMMVHTNWVLGW